MIALTLPVSRTCRIAALVGHWVISNRIEIDLFDLKVDVWHGSAYSRALRRSWESTCV